MRYYVEERTCKKCGKTFPGGNRAFFCKHCRTIRCPVCKRDFTVNSHRVGIAIYCSHACASEVVSRQNVLLMNRKKEILRGDKHPNWKGGKRKHTNGYVQVLRPNNPMADCHGYVMEHRLVISRSLHRPLKKGEQVHHINGDKTDNRIENLQLIGIREHARLHMNVGGN